MARENYEIRDKVVLITGASRGIGAEAARQLAARGAKLSLVGLEPDLLAERAAEVGPDAAWFEADVADNEALDAAVSGTLEHFGRIDVVVANAGIAPHGTVATIDPAEFERVIEVNLIGAWRTIRATLPHVVAQRGYILPISSLSAVVHPPLLASYAASKAGIEAFADSLRFEIAHTGTRVGVAYFGFIDTDMVRSSFEWRSSQKLREAGKRRLSVAPVSAAGKAIVRGIENRARYVYVPRWVLPAIYLRGFLQPLFDLSSARPEMVQAIEIADSETADEPVGDPSN